MINKILTGSRTRLLPFSIAVLTISIGYAQPSSATVGPDVEPELVSGNPSCATYGLIGFRIDPPNSGDYTDATTGAKVNVTIGESANGQVFDWSVLAGSTVPGFDLVIAKGSNAANLYYYDPISSGDDGLHSPVNASGKYADLSHIDFCFAPRVVVSKTATTYFERDWEWSIDKILKDPLDGTLTLAPGQTYQAQYDVTLGAQSTDGDYFVYGFISVSNPLYNGSVATITGVTDVISPNIAAYVECPVQFPYELAKGGTLECAYSNSLPNADSRVNTATVTTSGVVKGGTGTADVIFSSTPTNEYDECVDVGDSLVGALGFVCANELPKTFSYSYTIAAPEGVCESFTVENIASFETNDTSAIGADSASVEVDVACETGCTLTQGYWKTHSSYGPAPADATWLSLGDRDLDGANEGPNEGFFKSGKTWYQVLWTPPAGNAYYQLAHQYIAAVLNGLNGASTAAVSAALTTATALLNTYTPAQIAALKGNNATRAQFLSLAGTLGSYNEGAIGPGHCDQDKTCVK